MTPLDYLDFELRIERHGDAYRARVLRSPAGEASHPFELPITRDRIELIILKLGQARRRGAVRKAGSAELKAAHEIGEALYRAVFAEDVRVCFRTSIERAYSRPNTGLRIKLRLDDVPELGDLPWEMLLDASGDRFLAQSTLTPIVRYLELPQVVDPLPMEPPIEVLVVIASPIDHQPLNVEHEKKLLANAFGPLQERGAVNVTYIETATIAELREALRARPVHVFHFMGHGAFDDRSGEGVLVFEDELRRARPVDANRIAMLLHDCRTLRLAVLNACEGARISRTDPYAGVAASLVRQGGLPAVIAMQFEITDEAALTFTAELYSALAEGIPIDGALAEARKGIYSMPNDIEWGTPVLYMRSADGILFDIPPASRCYRAERAESANAAMAEATPRPATTEQAAAATTEQAAAATTKLSMPAVTDQRAPAAAIAAPSPIQVEAAPIATRPQPAPPEANAQWTGAQPPLENSPASADVTALMAEQAASARSRRWKLGGAAALIAAAAGSLFILSTAEERPDSLGRRLDEVASASHNAVVSNAMSATRATAGKDGANCPGGMVLIEGGTFTMGSDNGLRNEKPAHKEEVASFCLDRTEVTVQAYSKCSTCNRPTGGWCNAGLKDRSDHPMNCINFSEAADYCKHIKARLPTEAEWEYAARGTEGRTFAWGHERSPTGRLNIGGPSDSFKHTAPVKSFPEGRTPGTAVHNLCGNVWEWTSNDYKHRHDAPVDKRKRVIRGGGYLNNIEAATGLSRLGREPSVRFPDVGFRCAREPQ